MSTNVSETSMTSLTLGGSAASAQNAIYTLMGIYSQVSSMYSKLTMLETAAQYQGGKATSNDVESAADQQAKQMRSEAFGKAFMGGIEFVGAGASMYSESAGNKSVAGDEDEIKTMNEYRDEAQKRVTNEPEKTIGSAESDTTETINTRMEELMGTKDYSTLDLNESEDGMSDKKVIETSSAPDAQSLVKTLDDQIGNKEDSIKSKRSQFGRKADRFNQFANAIGQMGNALGGMDASTHQEKAGEFEADKTVAQTGAQLAQQTGSQVSQASTKFAEEAMQLPEILSQLVQGDVYRG